MQIGLRGTAVEPVRNLKEVMGYFGITNSQLARGLAVDPSLVSRWLNGQRKLKAASVSMDALAEYILGLSRQVNDMEWLRSRFEAAGLPTDFSSVYRIKQNLIMWLASDGEDLRRNLGGVPQAATTRKPSQERPATIERSADSAVRLGFLDVVLGFELILAGLPRESVVSVFLSNDQIATTVNKDVAALLLRIIEKNDLRIRMVVCVSGDTRAMSTLMDTYMETLVSGHVQLSVVHGLTQTVTNQMHLIAPGVAAVLVTEVPGVAAPPAAVVVREPSFVAEIQKSFEQASRYAQPVLSVYGDDFSRNILEIIYQEFCTPGDLDVVKDNVNPMYMTEDAYNRVLRTHGHSDEEYSWRCTEFTCFKSGMDETLKGGTVFREILSLARLNQVARDGFCRMPGLYFMRKGFTMLDAEGCAAVLNGYIRYLETVPNFHVLILDDISLLHSDNCWQLKQNHHLAINYWSGTAPVMIHSDQLMILREFQAHFDSLWAQGGNGIGNRSNVIVILQDVVKRLIERGVRPQSGEQGQSLGGNQINRRRKEHHV